MASSPLPSQGPKRGQNCYITPAFSGILNDKLGDKIRSRYLTLAFSGAQKKAELLRNPCILGIPNAKLGDKIRSGYLTSAFSGAQMRSELLRNPCIIGDPHRQARGQNQKWLPHPCLLWGPKEGGIAT